MLGGVGRIVRAWVGTDQPAKAEPMSTPQGLLNVVPRDDYDYWAFRAERADLKLRDLRRRSFRVITLAYAIGFAFMATASAGSSLACIQSDDPVSVRICTVIAVQAVLPACYFGVAYLAVRRASRRQLTSALQDVP